MERRTREEILAVLMKGTKWETLTKQEMFDVEWGGGVALKERFPETDFEEKLDMAASFPDPKFALRKIARDYGLSIPKE